jgi:hypothetical protein
MLKKLPPITKNNQCPSIINQYINQPTLLHNISFYEYVGGYDVRTLKNN